MGSTLSKSRRKSHRRRAVFESDQILDIPEDSKGYFLKKDGVKYYGRAGRKSIGASFTIPLQSGLLGYDFNYDVILQVMKNYVFVRFNYADLLQIYRLLKSSFKARFRLKKVDPIYDLLEFRTPWPCNEETLLFQFKHNPLKTLSFVKASLPELITIMSLRKIPREFNQPFNFILF